MPSVAERMIRAHTWALSVACSAVGRNKLLGRNRLLPILSGRPATTSSAGGGGGEHLAHDDDSLMISMVLRFDD